MSSSVSRLPLWAAPVAPFALFLLLTTLESLLPREAYPLGYTIKLMLVVGLLAVLRGQIGEARPGGKGWVIAAALGAALCLMWVWVVPHTPALKFLGTRESYNPVRELNSPLAIWAFLAVRFFGLVVVAPVVEELFYRGFLLRFVTDMDDFRRVPLGTFSALALVINVLVFALSHPEWLAAAIFALAMCLLLRGTRNLFACILAHGVTNLLLGVYVVQSGQWQLW